MFKEFKPEIKTFLIVALVAMIIAIGGILLLQNIQPAPVVQTFPPTPSPQLQTGVLDTSTWQTYRSDEFGFEVRYPSYWKLEEGYYANKYSGEDGYFQFQGVEEWAEGIDEISKYVAYFDERYGSKPVIENLKIEGQEARLILPSSDQSKDIKNEVVLIIRYPKPIVTQETKYPYLALSADAEHIRQILSTFRFVE